MYIPAEDFIETGKSLDDVVAEDVGVGTENEKKATNSKQLENKENISSDNDLTVKLEAVDKRNVLGLDRSKLEANATATIETAKKYASRPKFVK